MNTETTSFASMARRWRGQFVQIAAIVLLVLVAKGAVAEQFYVPSPSMEPTLLIGDALLASKYPYGYGAASLPIHVAFTGSGRVFGAMPKRGDVVVFRWPGDRSQAWVKRVIGLPGDRIQMRQGQLFINDRPAALKPDGIGEAEDDTGGGEAAYRYIETLPGGVKHAIFKMRDNGPLDPILSFDGEDYQLRFRTVGSVHYMRLRLPGTIKTDPSMDREYLLSQD